MSDEQLAKGLVVPARVIPIPTSVSPEAQAMLAMPSPYGAEVEPDPSDKAAWEEHTRERNEMLTHALAQGIDPATAPKVTEHRLSNSTLYEIEPQNLSADLADKALYVMHGGGFTVGSGVAAAYAAFPLAQLTGLRAFSIDYRMPPKSPFPAGLEDSVEAYRFVLERYAANSIAIYGPSAGGGMAVSCMLKARDEGLTMPAACMLHSPEADLTESGDSFETNLGIDSVLGRLTKSIALYADGHDLKDPYLSPLYGDFSKGFPPTMLTTGTRDLFLSNTVMMHRALLRADIPADLHVGEAMGHVGFYGAAPEDRELQQEQADFITRHLRAS
ncbi:MAG: alpha/beta hydrolase [Novosphingobium sp.]|nr:alpha/beta hydrolase [Novosphingobium sp.]